MTHKSVAGTACPGKHLISQLKNVDPRTTATIDNELSFGDLEIAPAVVAAGAGVVAAGAAVGTLGYTILSDVFGSGSEGDVSWNLTKMEGTKYPYDDKATYGQNRNYAERRFTAEGKLTAGFIDEISATFDITFSYDNNSVSNVLVENAGLNDAFTWGLVVNQDIRKVDTVTFVAGQPVAAVDVKFHYHFSSFVRDEILLIDYRLYGTGKVERTRYQWV